MFRTLVCVLVSVSASVASADALIAPSVERVSVSVINTDPAAPEIRFDGAGLPGGAYAEILGYLKNNASIKEVDNGFGTKFYRDACEMEVAVHAADSFSPEFLTFFATVPVSEFVRSNSGEFPGFAFGGKPAACLAEAMKASGINASTGFGSDYLYRGTNVTCGEHSLMFKRKGINCWITLK